MRLDLLSVTIWNGNDSTVKVLMTPEDWDKLWDQGVVWIDETNKERAMTIKGE